MSSATQPDFQAIASDPEFEIYSVLMYSGSLPANPAEPSLKAPRAYCYLLQYAVDRIRAAAVEFGFQAVIENLDKPNRTETLAEEIHAHLVSDHGELVNDKSQRFLVRAAFKKDGSLSIMSHPQGQWKESLYYPSPLPDVGSAALTERFSINPVHLDPEVTLPSPFTKHKTTHRAHYTAAWKRCGFQHGDKVEVLLHNDRDEISGAVFDAVYFLRDGGWVTPSSESGSKQSMSRRWALEHGGVKEAVIKVDDLKEGEVVWLSTAVAGFSQGRVTLKKK